MALKPNDLQDTVLKKISFDEFEPKTGDEKDVAVVGFYLSQESAGKDLYSFLNNSIVESRDIEVSPNPNDDGYYMVFIEMDRDENLLSNVREIVAEVERVSGKLMWEVKTPYLDDYVPLDEADQYIQQDVGSWKPADEFKTYLDSLTQEEEIPSSDEQIMEFLKNSNLLSLEINEGILNLADARSSTKLEFVKFGYGPDVMNELSINESAIKQDFDRHLFGQLRSMLGEMRALPIDQYIVIYNPTNTDVLITKLC